ncbi:hypothetical protein CYFUS_006387 [Cystobacter fuscus]|uniref:Uncharacterized protein n=1 Tax=Cystobacter fuscus TaxID=43 RepID=A0A250JAI8_9BACT|nr:hypothetical protein [Cystobacter fuscus]ATB40925.1 hypothetical protein CYFUS_006387 [Cystobacter fuscus]
MASPWDDFWPKFLLTVVDKVILGGAFALATYFLQKRLEVFKRDQAHASELAKSRIAAYHRVFAAESGTEFALTLAWSAVGLLGTRTDVRAVTEQRQEAVRRMDDLQKRIEGFQNSLGTERYLIGDNFARAALVLNGELTQALRFIQHCIERDEAPDKLAVDRRSQAIHHARRALMLCLPPFARAPAEDLQFSEPDVDDIYAGLTTRVHQAPRS